MIWKLLRKNISAGQICGYVLSNLLGLTIILCAVTLYGDLSALIAFPDTVSGKEYLVISRKVSTLSSLGISQPAVFTAGDIAHLEHQPWVARVGRFTAARFDVNARVSLSGDNGMATALFLESVPDSFLDIVPENWDWHEGEAVPVIISKDYLALYNFGFAGSRGLPQLSEGILGNVPLTLTLAGNGISRQIPARIAGFSSRLNTIAVPQAFMDAANEVFGTPAKDGGASRVIVEVSKPGDPAIEKYLDRQGYEVAGDKAGSGRAAYMLTVIVAIVTTIGAVITLLSFLVLTLSIFLLLQKNRSKLSRLLSLGYGPDQVSAPYCWMVLFVNALVMILSLTAVTWARTLWSAPLQSLGAGTCPWWVAPVTAVALIAVLTMANCLLIKRAVRKLF